MYSIGKIGFAEKLPGHFQEFNLEKMTKKPISLKTIRLPIRRDNLFPKISIATYLD